MTNRDQIKWNFITKKIYWINKKYHPDIYKKASQFTNRQPYTFKIELKEVKVEKGI